MSQYTELQKAAAYAAQDTIKFADEDEEMRALQQFHEEVDPETVLALIAENERMSTNCLGVKLDVFEIVCAERDQLKAENERLSTENSEIESAAITYIEDMQEAQRENARLTELFTVGMTLDGNLRVYGDWQSVRKAQEILAERDQLRAEIAGLKTGYEAYEQVNAELKAENEVLRANSSMVVLLPELDSVLEDLEIHGQHSDQGYRKLKDWYRKVDLACKAIDAAMGQGEKS